MTEEVERLRREADEYRGEIRRLRAEEEKLIGKCKRRDDWIAQLENENAELSSSFREATEAQARQARLMQERLKQTEELLEVRTARLSEAQTFLSTEDHLSEMEVLSIVRDLNENILQLAASLTAAWERLRPSQATGPIKVDLTSQPHHSVLVQLARKQDLTGLTFLLQSRLCCQAVIMTSSWVHNQEPGRLGSVYRHLSASGEHRIINTELYVTYVS